MAKRKRGGWCVIAADRTGHVGDVQCGYTKRDATQELDLQCGWNDPNTIGAVVKAAPGQAPYSVPPSQSIDEAWDCGMNRFTYRFVRFDAEKNRLVKRAGAKPSKLRGVGRGRKRRCKYGKTKRGTCRVRPKRHKRG